VENLGSSQGKELERPVKPKNFEKGFSEVQAKKGIEELMGKCVNGLMRERQRKIELGDFFHSSIIWYDYWISKPTNPDVKGVGKKEIKELFPNCKFEFHRITLAPPIARLLVRVSWILCELLEKLKIFNTHYLVVIKKK